MDPILEHKFSCDVTLYGPERACNCGAASRRLRAAGFFPWGRNSWIHKDDEGTVMSTADALADTENAR